MWRVIVFAILIVIAIVIAHVMEVIVIGVNVSVNVTVVIVIVIAVEKPNTICGLEGTNISAVRLLHCAYEPHTPL